MILCYLFHNYVTYFILKTISASATESWFRHALSTGCLVCLNTFTLCNYKMLQDFPGGPVVRNPPANAGDMGLIPDPGRSHVLQGNKACAPQLENSPHSRQLKKAGAQQQRPSTARN